MSAWGQWYSLGRSLIKRPAVWLLGVIGAGATAAATGYVTDFFKPIEKALSSVLPRSEQYVLHVSVTATQELKGLKPRKIKQTRDGIVDWVREVAPTLPVSPYFGALTWQSAAEVPFRMSLRNCGEVIDPDEQLWVVPIVENDLSEAWQNR